MDDFLYVSEVIKRKRFIDLNPQNIIKLRLFEQSSTPSRLFPRKVELPECSKISQKKCIEHKDQFLKEIQRFEKQIIFERKVHIRHFGHFQTLWRTEIRTQRTYGHKRTHQYYLLSLLCPYFSHSHCVESNGVRNSDCLKYGHSSEERLKVFFTIF